MTMIPFNKNPLLSKLKIRWICNQILLNINKLNQLEPINRTINNSIPRQL
ncbi:hypothetical protein [Plasmodium yoelii yoelii]|uniref:Uncharacterized protein n=1 Tax=Plasmodium yoelii yoelii TaxID=73239 RepID=Q7RCD6_PLAYO|nr:hypothetical protein [Plasmodium yoelii yoelii]